MATNPAPVYAGGSRRSAAPIVTQRAPQGTTAAVSAEELMRQLLGSFAAGQAATPTQAVASAPITNQLNLAEAIGSGSSVLDMGQDAAPATRGSPGQLSALGSGISALGVLGQNADLGQLGQALGLGGAVLGAKSPMDAALSMAPAALSQAGVPNVGLGMNALYGNAPGLVNSALALASPQMAALNALSSLLTGQSAGSLALSSPVGPAISLGVGALSDVAWTGLGALANAFSAPKTQEEIAKTQVIDLAPAPAPAATAPTTISESFNSGPTEGTTISGNIAGDSFSYTEAPAGAQTDTSSTSGDFGSVSDTGDTGYGGY